jgi:hypothetical protein
LKTPGNFNIPATACNQPTARAVIPIHICATQLTLIQCNPVQTANIKKTDPYSPLWLMPSSKTFLNSFKIETSEKGFL